MNTTDKLGYYLVGWKKFYNKTLALIESKKTGYDIIWVFNDEVYSSIDWTSPIEENLLSLYKKRAQQLRDKYDYLILFFSGGADSMQVLLSFIHNNIFLDEIIIQQPEVSKPLSNNKDTTNSNLWSEIDYSAIPFLNTHKNKINPRTKITFQDFSKYSIIKLEKDNWVEDHPICMSINVSAILRQITLKEDKETLKVVDTGKRIANIMGIDKPLVCHDGVNYMAYFSDTSAYHIMPPLEFQTENSTLIDNRSTEFFYWTSDMPQIVVKQAQEIKKHCESNPHAKLMAGQILKVHINEFKNILHPVIYEREVFAPFQTEKPSTKIFRPMDNWFWHTTNKTVQNNYLESIKHIGTIVDNKKCIEENIENGFQSILSKFYKL